MTIDEPFERIEHVTAGIAEERRKDREENRQIWREAQRQIGATQRQINETQRQLGELAVRMNDLTLNAADTDERVDKLVSAIGEFLRRNESCPLDYRFTELSVVRSSDVHS